MDGIRTNRAGMLLVGVDLTIDRPLRFFESVALLCWLSISRGTLCGGDLDERTARTYDLYGM
jgi:hypothetical protein